MVFARWFVDPAELKTRRILLSCRCRAVEFGAFGQSATRVVAHKWRTKLPPPPSMTPSRFVCGIYATLPVVHPTVVGRERRRYSPRIFRDANSFEARPLPKLNDEACDYVCLERTIPCGKRRIVQREGLHSETRPSLYYDELWIAISSLINMRHIWVISGVNGNSFVQIMIFGYTIK